jgi:6-phosphofructokinase 1
MNMNIAVAQSGGPTCVINASLLGVFREALADERVEHIYGSLNGIEGILNDRLIDLGTALPDAHHCALLRQTPAAALGSCRKKMPKPAADPQLYAQIAERFAQYNIGAFFYIGGNDSMDTTAKLSAYFASIDSPIRVIGVPKTIDNDLMHTDHTPGFGSAARYLNVTLQEIVMDCSVYDLPAVTIVEIMGRNAGWLTASSCLLRDTGEAAPHLVYLPEGQLTLSGFLNDVRNQLKERNTVIVAVSEGCQFADADHADALSGAVDSFGHKYLSGIGKFLEEQVRSNIGCKVRSIELNLMQRCSSHLASATDLDEAEAVGRAAVRAALNGETGRMMAFHRVSDEPYRVEIRSVDAAQTANGVRAFPTEWIAPAQNQITDDALPYFRPLVAGAPEILHKNGMPLVIRLH